MKLYSTGTLAVIAGATALVAHMERMDGFSSTYKTMFLASQGILILVCLGMVLRVLTHWHETEQLTKATFFFSLAVMCFTYALAWTTSKYGGILIFCCALTNYYITRKRAGSIKKK